MIKRYFTLVFLSLMSTALFAQFGLQNLKVNYETTPLGIDNEQHQFSWQMKNESDVRGLVQTAYQLVVRDEANQKVWDSGKVISGFSHGIFYKGEKLKPTTRYTWGVTVWDNQGRSSQDSSWFETGLMNPKIAAWDGAQWIGGGEEDMVFYSHYLSVFKLGFAVQIDADSKSTKASFVFGANDSRMSNKNLNLMGLEKGYNESYIALEIDISKLNAKAESTALLNIYRVGFDKNDKAEVPFKTVAIPREFINDKNKYEKHKVFAKSNFGVLEFFIDGEDESHRLRDASMEPLTPYSPGGLNLNPIGNGNNAICFPMLADIGFKVEKGQTAYFSEIELKNFREPGNILYSSERENTLFNGLPKVKNAFKLSGEQLITADPSKNAAPMLRTEFKTAEKKVKKARLYVTARGIYELYLNGEKIGDDYFNPGLTQYNKHHMYQTYDISSLIQSNAPNAFGAWLGEGWWSGNITYLGDSWNYFGDKQSLLSKIVITYEDGSTQIVTSNTKDWKLFTDGPIRVGSFFQGEVYDAGKDAAVKGWTTANYSDEAWKKAVEVPLEGNAYLNEVKDMFGRTSSLNYNELEIIGQYGENAKVVKTLEAIDYSTPRPGVFVYDMGQNMVGIPEIKIKNGKKGQVINLRFAEILYPDLPEYKGNEGMVMMENIRAALTQDQYVLKGGDEVIKPRFTFHGYRFVEITGIEKSLPVADVKGLVISSVEELSSSYKTNNPEVNKLWENITWSLRSNFLSIPTDCPQRNERMGWSGDISVFAKSSTYLTDASNFLKRHLLAMRDIQYENGRFTDVAPVGGGFGGTLWGSAGIVVAWETFQQYGDMQLLQEHYDAMKRYVDFLATMVNEEGILNEGPLGDWLSPEGNKNDNTLFWMAYYAYDLEIMSKMAMKFGKEADARKFMNKRAEVRKVFNKVYVDAETGETIKSGIVTGFLGPPGENRGDNKTDKGQLIDTQASYAIPLALGVFSGENVEKAIKNLAATIQRKNTDDGGVERPEYSLMTGFIGTASINEALSAHGRDDLAYQLLVNKQYPSWLYSVVNGATSIWERLNSYTVEDGFGGNNSMNSFNHYSFGAIAAWMYNSSLGIQRDPTVTAFKQFVLKPSIDPTGQIKEASGHYDSVYGRIESAWHNEGDKLTFKIRIPANTTAKVFVPAKTLDQVTESGKAIATDQVSSFTDNAVVLDLGSGSYSFEVRK